jgi:uncharacterized membrane protein YeaQ/YmgE (transglycosylase-associated protein family)
VILYVLSLILGGLIVGALGRLLVPGRQAMSVVMTILVGIGGSLLGGFVGSVILGRPGGFFLAVGCSALIVYLLSRSRRV